MMYIHLCNTSGMPPVCCPPPAWRGSPPQGARKWGAAAFVQGEHIRKYIHTYIHTYVRTYVRTYIRTSEHPY